jgi:hypothetical protein
MMIGEGILEILFYAAEEKSVVSFLISIMIFRLSGRAVVVKHLIYTQLSVFNFALVNSV